MKASSICAALKGSSLVLGGGRGGSDELGFEECEEESEEWRAVRMRRR